MIQTFRLIMMTDEQMIEDKKRCLRICREIEQMCENRLWLDGEKLRIKDHLGAVDATPHEIARAFDETADELGIQIQELENREE